ncbi:MAG: outer membrane protein OmpA-like peptidoglycan-associated protein [Granulosicoccus sp.]|jgi:outer membrane protein OmpA-like peptidoglycan-associated protein
MHQCSYVFRKTALIITLAGLSAGLVGVASASLSDQWFLGAGVAGSQLLPRAEASEVTRVEEIGHGATVFIGRDFDERSSGQFQLYSLGEVVFSDDSTATYTAADASLLFRFYDSRDNQRNVRLGLSVYGRFGFGIIERDAFNPIRTEGASPVYFGAGGGLEAYLTDIFAVRSEFIFHDTDTVSAHLSVVARFGGRKSRRGALSAPPIPALTAPPMNTTISDLPAQGGTQPQTTASPAAKPQALPIPTLDEPTNGPQTIHESGGTMASDSNPDSPIDPANSSNADLPEVAIMVDPREFNDPEVIPVIPVIPVNLVTPQPVQPEPTPTTQEVQSDTDNDGITDDLDQCSQSNQNYPVRQDGCSLIVHMGSQIQFVENSPLPLPPTELILQQLAAEMTEFPTTRIELIAHTDNAGTPQTKSLLTRQRLRAIGIYLVQRGITQDRFLLRSFSDKRPAFDNSSVEGRRANNRIEIVERP